MIEGDNADRYCGSLTEIGLGMWASKMVAHSRIQIHHQEPFAAQFPGTGLFAALARGIAFSLGIFCALNEIVELRYAGLHLNLCWIDFRPLPPVLFRPFLVVSALFLIAYAVKPEARPWRRRITIALIWMIFAVATWNVIHYYLLLAGGFFQTTVPVPLSLFVMAGVAVVLLAALRTQLSGLRVCGIICAGAVLAANILLFPIIYIVCFGKTDYKRPADAIVVFGARVYADGRLSDALADRMRTACNLYTAGLAPKMVLSGGPGDGQIHETQAMRRFAVSLGVPQEAIIIDTGGHNTRATVKNTCHLFKRMGVKRVLAVSHFYHLPRIKISYQSGGYEVYTVPARETYILTEMPYLIVREVAALWFYYVRFLTG